MTEDLTQQLNHAVAREDLLASSRDNIVELLESSDLPLYHDSVRELAEGGHWAELNDRFFQKLRFGTGGLRGRSIGKIVTAAEKGTPTDLGRPEFPCVGTNVLNFYNLSRATQGLIRYLKAYRAQEQIGGKPSLVIAYDTRHFATEFAELVAKVAVENGCDVYLFKEPRSTPELSFAVRHLEASSGIVLTASHNPPHDNGYKAYWDDGCQVVEPHASAIINEVNSIAGDHYTPLPEEARGELTYLGEEMDAAYMDRLEDLLLDPELVKRESSLKIVFTNLHGTGGKISPPMLRRLGFQCDTVAEQDVEDGRFPTVASPNPENGPALSMAIEQAEKTGADLVIGTDPDCDRMGVAVRGAHNKMFLITGNQIGSLMGYYRIKTFFDQGILNDGNKQNAVLVKTFVTTELQRAVANAFGIRCIDTLTGFKYIGQKLTKYEKQIPAHLRSNYRRMTEAETRALRLEHSSFFVFGGEESYGYLGSDYIRDKDGNGAVVMFAELAAYAKSLGKTIVELLDDIYLQFGYYVEKLHSLVMEGAEGADKIRGLAKSYSEQPPDVVDGSPVKSFTDFATQDIIDPEGDPIPREGMLMVELEDGRAFAVRPSGTEPKIKYYLYSRNPAPEGGFPAEDLPALKDQAAHGLQSLWTWLEGDIATRMA